MPLGTLTLTTFLFSKVPLNITDRIGTLNIKILLTVGGSVLGLSCLAVRDTASLFIVSAIFGFFAGATTTVTAVIDAALCPTLDVVSVRMGILLVPWEFGLLIGEPTAGTILASSYGWTGLQFFLGSVVSAALAPVVAVRVVKCGWGMRTKS